MFFVKIVYFGEFSQTTEEQYTEIGDDLSAVRHVDVLKSGDIVATSREKPIVGQLAMLPEGKFPVDEVVGVPGEYSTEFISERDFEEAWAKATSERGSG